MTLENANLFTERESRSEVVRGCRGWYMGGDVDYKETRKFSGWGVIGIFTILNGFMDVYIY